MLPIKPESKLSAFPLACLVGDLPVTLKIVVVCVGATESLYLTCENAQTAGHIIITVLEASPLQTYQENQLILVRCKLALSFGTV